MTAYRQRSWSQIDMDTLPKEDSLLACLVLLTRYFQNPFSAQSLSARLPLKKDKLDKALFPRAAKRAQIEAGLKKLSFDEIEDHQLPMVLLLKDDKACILFLDEKNTRKILDPAHPQSFLEPEDAQKHYLGSTFLVHSTYKFTDRAEETLSPQKKDWFWSVLIKSWPIYSEIIIASLLINLFALVIPLFTMNIYNRVVPNNATATMWILASGVAVVFIFDILLKSLRSYFIDLEGKKSDIQLSSSIFEQILGTKLEKRPQSVGTLANSVQSFESFKEFITSSTILVLVDFPFIIIYILTIYIIGGSLFWIPLIVIPLIFALGFCIQLPLIQLTRESFKYSAEKQAILYESLANIETVKISGAESRLQAKWEQLLKLSAINNLKLRNLSNLSINATSFIQQAASIVTILVGVYLIAEGDLNMGALIACTILTGRAVAPMAQVTSLFTRYYQSKTALDSIDNLMQMPRDVQDTHHYLHRPKIKGDIAFKNVSFAYNNEKVPALIDIKLQIKAGERVAIIGKIGSGKSTLAKLLLQLYLPTEGHILIDGTDYRQINPDDLRQQIGYVPQEALLFYGSVRDNICLGAPFIDDEKLIRAANIANIGEITNKHPDGFDRQVGEQGKQLSGGQRQSIIIARALLRDPKIILMDEPTASMDDTTERLFKQNFTQMLTPEHTLMLITHKVSMLELVQRIIVLEEGRIVADGPKEAVIAALRSSAVVMEKK